ncbi:PREDICTED: calcium-binding and coiled-coil domain-containing protein 2-like isoform X2 [Populus euphratica]|uniref:Calcium-binding and coiled-coil domain-containing protein 2-like isoform X2 n=1 Tax=Populus euphratica TaxID=75702 RepID=A0AAJ6TT22_POPEU|nr:PREDICTED: calcium-binding and coiled-coil domain-containing protein 2-like isoform X2 [Populus euphratica]XP_011016621.1 PREDICTED: calcium-binding and coiled-coil domain-containing protein 2-like isoform X2 [Populus euphratica]
MDPLDIVYLREPLDTMHQPNRSGATTSALNETANSAYGANHVPIEQYPSPLLGESPNTAHANLKRKAPEIALDRQKKREIDRAYRLRCREKKIKTEQDLVLLTEENNKLKSENEQLKREGVKQPEMVQTQKEEMKAVKNDLSHLKDQLRIQNAVVEVLSSQVASRKNNMDLQCENKRLRFQKSLLIKKIDDNDYLNDVIQLQENYTKLEQEKKALQVIIDALREQIKQE